MWWGFDASAPIRSHVQSPPNAQVIADGCE